MRDAGHRHPARTNAFCNPSEGEGAFSALHANWRNVEDSNLGSVSANSVSNRAQSASLPTFRMEVPAALQEGFDFRPEAEPRPCGGHFLIYHFSYQLRSSPSMATSSNVAPTTFRSLISQLSFAFL